MNFWDILKVAKAVKAKDYQYSLIGVAEIYQNCLLKINNGKGCFLQGESWAVKAIIYSWFSYPYFIHRQFRFHSKVLFSPQYWDFKSAVLATLCQQWMRQNRTFWIKALWNSCAEWVSKLYASVVGGWVLLDELIINVRDENNLQRHAFGKLCCWTTRDFKNYSINAHQD